MIPKYDPIAIEPKWQKTWADSRQDSVAEDTSRPKKYVLEMSMVFGAFAVVTVVSILTPAHGKTEFDKEKRAA